jgi:hypothetical protein
MVTVPLKSAPGWPVFQLVCVQLCARSKAPSFNSIQTNPTLTTGYKEKSAPGLPNRFPGHAKYSFFVFTTESLFKLLQTKRVLSLSMAMMLFCFYSIFSSLVVFE